MVAAIDESARRRFEAEWIAGTRPSIESTLSRACESKRLATLEELVCIDLEYACKSGLEPELGAYLTRFPELDQAEIRDRLEAEASQIAQLHSRTRGRYRLTQEVGRGGMGVVWRAEDPELGRDVALKEMQTGLTAKTELQGRFIEEARLTAGLEHPGIVAVHALHSDEESPYYTMRLVEGRTLAEATDLAEGLLERRRLVEAVLAVARTIAFAHRSGVVHRDLKPANVIIGEHGEAVILDWGLAALSETPCDAVGTPAYMAPEQAGDGPLTPLMDVYGLGALLCHVVTGRPPNSDRLGRPAPPELRAIADLAMRFDPEERYPSAEAFAADLERYLAGEPTLAWPEPWHRRLTRWAARRRALVASAMVGTVMASLLAVLALDARHRRAQDEARRLGALQRGLDDATASAEEDLAEGHWSSAVQRLARSLDAVEGEPIDALAAELVATRAASLAGFAEHADAAGQLAFLGRDVDAAREAEGALVALGVLDHPDWWAFLPEDLPPERIDDLQWQVWDQLGLLSSLLAADQCDSARALAAHAAEFRPSPRLDRVDSCLERDPCLEGGRGYWSELERARCGYAPVPTPREAIGFALRAEQRLADDDDPRDGLGDLQAAMDADSRLAEVQWRVAQGFGTLDFLSNDVTRAFATAIELELDDTRPRSPAALALLEERLERARAHESSSEDLADLLARAESKPRAAAALPASERLPAPGEVHTLALLNAGFELGLARHWGRGMYEDRRPIWWNGMAAWTEAEISDVAHSGGNSLHIVNHTPTADHHYGTTVQTIPAEEGVRYSASVWLRGTMDLAGPAKLIVCFDEAWTLCPIHYVGHPNVGLEWIKLERFFVAPSDTLHVRIVSTDTSELWLDDLKIQRAAP